MLENNTTRIILAMVAMILFSVILGIVVYYMAGGEGSIWSVFSWLDVKQSSAAI